jgi:hypothetical protein
VGLHFGEILSANLESLTSFLALSFSEFAH